MQKRKLGRHGPAVSEIGLGCMGMSWAYGTPDDAESIATLERALELGVDFFDTAEVYGPFENEKLVGRVLGRRRGGLTIATKFGFRFEDGGMPKGMNGRPENAKAVAEASLERLGLDVIDLFYLHRVDPTVPVEETVGGMAELVKEGKVRHLGLSEATADEIRRGHATHPIAVLQSEYSIWERGVEAEILPTLRELGIGFVPFSPLGRGFLTGTLARAEELPKTDYRHMQPRMQGENYDANMGVVDALKAIGEAKGANPAQIALAWVLAQGEDVIPIPGTKRRKYLEENVAAADIVLTADDLAALERAVPKGSTAGARYPASTLSRPASEKE
ncbi:MAG TPA: aldo/keto reductase [Alphaproteobacteria bacterium]|jgi:aryl-alcohol dehydrogenase-like predicted oxidoreductase|nr:aldo/keto reductase [Alphaproteobacteria bacterium]